jgi:hypothetical protein
MDAVKIEEKSTGMIEIRTNEEKSILIATVWMSKNTGVSSRFLSDNAARKIAQKFKDCLEEPE